VSVFFLCQGQNLATCCEYFLFELFISPFLLIAEFEFRPQKRALLRFFIFLPMHSVLLFGNSFCQIPEISRFAANVAHLQNQVPHVSEAQQPERSRGLWQAPADLPVAGAFLKAEYGRWVQKVG